VVEQGVDALVCPFIQAIEGEEIADYQFAHGVGAHFAAVVAARPDAGTSHLPS
jgi:hypothetical protein